MKQATLDAAKQHAIDCFPHESCGLVVVIKGKEKYSPCANAAASAGQHFVIPARALMAAEDKGKVTAVVHSHPQMGAQASEADLVACESSMVEWVIIAVHLNAGESYPVIADVKSYKPRGYKAPLVGREFHYGTLDCYTLVQDWYERERGIILRDMESKDGWWDRGEDLYMKKFEEYGFARIDSEKSIEVGDVILMQIKAPVANHAAVYLGDTRMLHHMYGRLSTRDVYGGYWREVTRAIVRYVGE